MPTYIVKVTEEIVDLYTQINPNFPKLRPDLKGAVIFKVDTVFNKINATYTRYLSNKQKQHLMDSLDEAHLGKINQIRLSKILEE